MKHLGNVVMLALLAAGILLGADKATRAGEAAVALKGYDPVAYFTDKRPIVGDPQYQYEWDGAVYHFASAEHLALFKSDPDRYLPQYKNWCAASVAKGEKVYGNPEWWLVVDGRLYLFGKPIGPGLMSKDPAAMKSRLTRTGRTSRTCPTRRRRTTCEAQVNHDSSFTGLPLSTRLVDMRDGIRL